jgi:hypothetical protein
MKERNLMPSGNGSSSKKPKPKAKAKPAAKPESLMQRASEGFDNFRRQVSPIYRMTNPKKKA